jgi:hypothetical protein
MATALRRADEERILEAARTESETYSRNFLKIVPKERSRGLIPFEFNEAQRRLDAKLEEQRLAGKPQFAIVLKARQIGISTYGQAKLIQRATLSGYHQAVVVAHDVDAGSKLFAIGQRMYRNLPEGIQLAGIPLRPEVRSYRQSRKVHFGQAGHVGMVGEIWPDSSYWVDTAAEFESGRGSTPNALWMSEYAFWPQPEQKFIALMQAVPDSPDTLVVIESTANGMNHFEKLWTEAVAGQNEFVPFFWPWWKQDEYARPFATDRERAEFRVGDTEQSPFAEREPELLDPGPIDIDTGEHVPLSLEQLNWRRWAIANRCGGSIDKFNQEYPSTPADAFLATGRKVFEPMLVARARARAEQTDPRFGEGGPVVGAVLASETKMQAGLHGKVEVPKAPIFKPARLLRVGEDPNWRFWLDYEDGKLVIPEDDQYVVGVDVSEGLPESEDDAADPAFNAIVVINHRTKEQVAEYRSRVDADELAEHAVLISMLFNDAWLAIEKTGPGLAVVRKVWLDFHYTFTYFRKKHEHRDEGGTDRLGWDTNRATKPLLIEGIKELLREGTHGVRSRRLVGEMETYVRLSTGKLVPERGKFSDVLMAWGIAQQVAIEKPIRKPKSERGKKRASRTPPYSAYRGRR